MNKPHKHAALIKAWADGAVVQYYDSFGEEWRDSKGNRPEWLDNLLYRIKPEPSDLEKYGVEYGDVWAMLNGGFITIACPSVGVQSCRTIYEDLLDKKKLKTLMFRRGVVNKL